MSGSVMATSAKEFQDQPTDSQPTINQPTLPTTAEGTIIIIYSVHCCDAEFRLAIHLIERFEEMMSCFETCVMNVVFSEIIALLVNLSYVRFFAILYFKFTCKIQCNVLLLLKCTTIFQLRSPAFTNLLSGMAMANHRRR